MPFGKKSIYCLIVAVILLIPLVSSAQEESGVSTEEVAVYSFKLTEKEIKKEKEISSPDGNFSLTIPAGAFSAPVEIELKKRITVDQEIPEGQVIVSDYWEYNLLDKKIYNRKKPITVEINYQENIYLKKIVFWNGKTWQEVPSRVVDPAGRFIQAKLTLPYARLMVLADESKMSEGMASWYRYKGCLCAASPDYPKGTKLRVTNINNNKSVVVKVNDFGPERELHPDRVIDLDVTAFKKLASKSSGLINVLVEPVL